MKKWAQLCALSACGLLVEGLRADSDEIKRMQVRTLGSLTCSDFRSQVFDLAYEFLRQARSESELQSFLDGFARIESSDVGAWGRIAKLQLPFLKKSFRRLYLHIFFGHPEFEWKAGGDWMLDRISAAELGDRTSPASAEYLDKLNSHINGMRTFGLRNAAECLHAVIPEPRRASINPTLSAKGARKSLNVFYQSCQPMELAPLGPEHMDVDGIKITGRHPAGGNKRIVEDAARVRATHHYLRFIDEYESGCINVKNSPPIYDFGGKPYTSNGVLDFFRNAGSGTEALGVDCSAIVFTSLASMGMRVKASQKLKPEHVHGISSTMFKEPQSNGLTCLNKVAFTPARNEIEPGDIIAISGHVVIVESVGEDTFGLDRIRNVSDCTFANMKSENFNFIIVQSNPGKGGIGVNRMRASDYFPTEPKLNEGIKKQAQNACYAKFSSNTRVSTSTLSVVRHKGTSDCVDSALPMRSEACVASCNI
jgi:hypothetical protein